MPELTDRLRQQFPSLAEEDAAKASQQIKQAVPQLTAPYDDAVVDPGNDTLAPVASEMQPAAQPTVQSPVATPTPTPAQGPVKVSGMDVRDALKELADPAAFARSQEAYDKASKTNINDHVANILGLTPRGGKFGNLIEGIQGRKRGLAKADMDRRFEAMKLSQSQENWSQEQTIRQAKEARDAELDRLRIEKEKASGDVNSPQAELYRRMIDKLSPEQRDVVNKLTPEQLKESSTMVQGIYNEMNRRETNRLKQQELSASQREKSDLKRDQAASKLAADFQTDMDSFKGRTGAFGKTQETLNNIQRAKGLLAQFEDGNLPPAQVAELTEAWSRAISGSASSEERIRRLLPDSYKGDVNRFMGELMNEPRGAGQQKFVKLIAESLDREEKINGDIIKGAQVQRAMSGKHELYRKNFPEKFKSDLYGLGLDPDTEIDPKTGRYLPKSANPDKKVPGKSVKDMTDEEVMNAAKAKGWIK